MRIGRYGGLLAVFIAGMNGCATPQPERFYTLVVAPAAHSLLNTEASVALGPITLPALIDRPQLVVTQGEHEVQILEQQRWAAPLRQEIPRVIAARIETIAGRRVVVYPERTATPQFKVTLSIVTFDSRLGSSATVTAEWEIKVVATGMIHAGQSVASEVVATNDYAALVAAHARALARIGDEVAAAINGLGKAKPTTMK